MKDKLLVPIFALAMAGFWGLAAAEEDVRKVQSTPPETAVIEEKCLVCHNRKRIDEAIEDRRNIEEVLLHMEKKGVVLSEQERRVLGVFGTQKPFKDQK